MRTGNMLRWCARPALSSVRPRVAAGLSQLRRPQLSPGARCGAAAAAGTALALSPPTVLAQAPGAAAALSPTMLTVLNWGPAIAVQVFFLSPLLDVKKWQADGTTGDMPSLPYYAMPGNGFLWLTYGALNDMNMTIITANTPGFVLGMWYAYNFSKYKAEGVNTTLPMLLAVTTAAVTTGSAALLPLEQAKFAIGSFGCGVVIAMFSGPVNALGTVLKTKSTNALSLPLTLAAFINCALWVGFGWYVIDDPFVYFPNGVGLIIQVLGLLMFVRFGLPKA